MDFIRIEIEKNKQKINVWNKRKIKVTNKFLNKCIDSEIEKLNLINNKLIQLMGW